MTKVRTKPWLKRPCELFTLCFKTSLRWPRKCSFGREHYFCKSCAKRAKIGCPICLGEVTAELMGKDDTLFIGGNSLSLES